MYSFSLPAQVARYDGALDTVGEVCRPLGQRVLVIGGHTAIEVVRERLLASLARAELTLAGLDWYGGLCSPEIVAGQAAKARELGAEVIIAVGGGKAIDTAKSVAKACGVPVVAIPTIAATCAAFSTVSATYRPDGSFLALEQLPAAPVAVLIDSGVIARAPLRWLAAGMGDTLAKWYEIRAVSAGREVDGPTLAAQMNGRLCYDLIERFGAGAVAAVKAGTASPALEAVLDSIFAYAGMTSIMGVGAHSAAAHGVYIGFASLEKTRELGHGFLVGYGNLVLLVLEKRPDAEIIEAIHLARACSVPYQLSHIAQLSREELQQIARASAGNSEMAHMPFPVSAADVLVAMDRLEVLGAGI
jgi:glycerol dehydrogenase-like iron-containing ADH family enzyme